MRILSTELELNVRFSETDAMGVVWHGNYLKFFEDAREFFGEQYGLEYLTMYNNGYFTPIVESAIQHKSPIYYGQKIKVKATLTHLASAKIQFAYEVLNTTTQKVAATGTTTQVFLGKENQEMALFKPDFYAKWEEQQNWIEVEE